MSKIVQVGNLSISNDRPLVFIAGPCVIEGREFALDTAKRLADIFSSAGMVGFTNLLSIRRTVVPGALSEALGWSRDWIFLPR